jgi:two-component system OmpR family sensor kinase
VRLTASFALVAVLVLVIGGAAMYVRMRSELDQSVNTGLRSRAGDLTLVMRTADAGSPVLGVGDNGESIAQVVDASGRVLDATRSLRGRSALTAAQRAMALRHEILIDRPRLRGTDEALRLLAEPIRLAGRRVILVVGAPLENRDAALAGLRRDFEYGLPLAVILSAVGGFALASAALRPVGALRRGAERITRTGPRARLDVPPAGDEIGELARTLNEMLARLDDASERERRFVADASHELRSPLALLQSELEVALRGPRRVAGYERVLRLVSGEVAGLAQLSNDLLLLARADEDELPLRPQRVEPRAILDSLSQRFGQRAASAGREISVARCDAGAVEIDRMRVEQALSNLIENALRHGAGPITLAAREDAETVEFAVGDGGRGISEAFAPHAFERFTREDAARSGSGAGLGLAIVDLVARAHGGTPLIRRNAGRFEVGISLPRRETTRRPT